MTKTTNYQLNQWDEDDYVKRTDFNADNAKIDAGIAAAAVAPCCAVDSFTGDGTLTRTFNVGFAPSAVILCANSEYRSDTTRVMYIATRKGSKLFCKSEASLDSTSDVQLTDTGFTVTQINNNMAMNKTGCAHFYIAFR